MKYPTVSALCEGVAGAIREKEGSSALINPQDFVERINALSIGGGGDAEYGVYLKILDVDAKIDGGVDSTLNVDSPEVVEFLSDAFEWGKVVHYDGAEYYSKAGIPHYISILAYEAKRKEMGLPNVYDTLQKRVPILAVKTKSIYDGEEKLLLLDNITREENGEMYISLLSFATSLDEAIGSIYNYWQITVQFRKDGIFIASID